jgi:hypothetical protein
VLERLRRDGGGAWRGIGEAALCLLLGAAPVLYGEACMGFRSLSTLGGLAARSDYPMSVSGYIGRVGSTASAFVDLWTGRSGTFAAHYDTPFISVGWTLLPAALWGAVGVWAAVTAGRGRGWLAVPLAWVFGMMLWAPFSPKRAVSPVHLFFLHPFPAMAVAAVATHLYARFRARPFPRALVAALVAVTAGTQAADLAAFALVLARRQVPADPYAEMARWMAGTGRPAIVLSDHYYRGFLQKAPGLRAAISGEEGNTGLPRPPVLRLYAGMFEALARPSGGRGPFHVLLLHDGARLKTGPLFESWRRDPAAGPGRVAARFLDWDGCVLAEAYRFGEGTSSLSRAQSGTRAEGGGRRTYRTLLEDGGESVTGRIAGGHRIPRFAWGDDDAGL